MDLSAALRQLSRAPPRINHLPAAASADVPAQQQTFSQQDAPAADGETSVFMLSQVASSAAPSRVLEEVSELVQQHYWDPSLNGAADEWDGIVQKYRSKARDMDKRQSGAEDYRYYTLLQDMVNELDDRYSRVLAPPAAAEVLRAYDVLGVGIQFTSDVDGRVLVKGVPLAGSSAAKAGLQGGDEIVAINGLTLRGLSPEDFDASILKSGDPQLTMKIKRISADGPSPSLEEDLTLERTSRPPLSAAEEARVRQPVRFFVETLSAEEEPDARDGRRVVWVGYIQILDFNSRVEREVARALKRLQYSEEAVPPSSLILDLRGNTGGDLQSAVNIASLFSPSRPLLLVDSRTSSDSSPQTIDTRGPWTTDAALPLDLAELPVVILVDAKSASASEVLAGGLRRHCRAALVGETTKGKATMQEALPLSDGGFLLLSTKHFKFADGLSYDEGVAVDVPMTDMSALQESDDVNTQIFQYLTKQKSVCDK
ncbi:unnamed protein product [Vitrella brassicaformis CCMP3155]|uniref:PDZ domain-containing protein n=2 Tax=Vitrella brassicaformis TaxID=1169539 RepID=A0A0G4FJ14_VITBC|nr:unnamed protein product [Vitrella brassicaformis CCMP3155]|eukprot:CEM13709.1 unnamed protein product [Vitrella brassicaformis CCMP3155]